MVELRLLIFYIHNIFSFREFRRGDNFKENINDSLNNFILSLFEQFINGR